MSELLTNNITGLPIPSSVNTPSGPLDPNNLQSSSPSSLSASSSPVAADASGGLGGISGNISYTGTTPRVIDSDLTITNIATLNGARVLISNFDASRDRLAIGEATSGSESGVTWNYDQTRGVLTLDSNEPVSSDVYQNLLRRATYANTDPNNPGPTRTIQFSLGNLLANPENGHFYEFVTGGNNVGISWNDAETAAASRNYLGRQGYLTTITSQAEQDFVQSRVSGNGWIGASDEAVEGEWRWVTGPETGTLYWQGTGADFNNNRANNASPVGGFYNNWDLQNNEPNNATDGGKPNGEDYAHIVGDANAGNIGKWNDLPDQQDYTNFIAYKPQGYIVEYGGLSTDTSPVISASVTLNFGGAVGSGGTPAVGTRTTVPNFGGTPDSNGYNRPEIFWRNYGTNPNSIGLNAIWGLDYDPSNTTNAFSRSTDPKLTKFIDREQDTNWDIEGLYDVDGNGVSDIFWRNYRTGENALWFMRLDSNNGLERDLTRTQFLLQEPDANWEIEGVTNFDNTPSSTPNSFGILWHNYRTGETAIWAYNFNSAISGAGALSRDANRTQFVGPNVSTDWRIEGWADFNNDQVADILWRNYRTGENAIWKLNANAGGSNPYFNVSNGYFITEFRDTLWEVADVFDFDRDGVADILWRNYRTGENSVWGMQSGGDFDSTKTGLITEVPDTQWNIEGTADFTGDLVPDLLWRNYRTGENAIWRMRVDSGRLVRDQGFFIPSEDDLGWEIEGPGPTRDIV